MTVKAIEARYRGYRFRSRLEARWAVFFDALKVRWEYEEEGFAAGASEFRGDLMPAMVAARGARFEHGECG